MKNTLENKTKFFAQYWGQKVLNVAKDMPLQVLDNFGIHCDGYLELKPLSQRKGIDIPLNKIEVGEADYLRSMGYALDWNGITVKEMVEFGWIKLKG